MSAYAIDKTHFYEPVSVRAGLGQNSIVTHGKNKFTVDRWFKGGNHCFVFVPFPGVRVKPFVKKPSEVRELIDSNTISSEHPWPLA